MSDLKSKIQIEVERQAKVDELNKGNRARQAYITSKKTEFELERIVQNERELKRARETQFGELSTEEIATLQRNNEEYFEAAKERMPFINNEFNGIVPYFRKNLLLIGAKTGDGKSTTVANIISETMQKMNPKTGRPMRCLVLTNEEKSEDVYNRVTCHIRGWNYVNHDKFSIEQKIEFNRMIPILSEGGRLTVIDNSYNKAFGLTTSVEGIESIFDSLIAGEQHYDVVLIDYYQKVKYSKKQPHLNEYEVQAMLANALDNYKNIYPAPIVLLAQVEPNSETDPQPFEKRVKGRKVISDVATFIMEVVANRKELETRWLIHKSRFAESVGEEVITGFDRGRYVEMTDQFRQAKAELLARKEAAKQLKAMNQVALLNEGKGESQE